jgi:hypothetical protein
MVVLAPVLELWSLWLKLQQEGKQVARHVAVVVLVAGREAGRVEQAAVG